MGSFYKRFAAGLFVLALLLPAAAQAATLSLRVAVIDNSPPMSFRTAQGNWSGFSVSLMRALCAELQASCEFVPVTLDQVLDRVSGGELDVAAVALLETPERRARLLLTKAVFRSRSIWLAAESRRPGAQDVVVAVVKGSAQARYADGQGWRLLPLSTNGELGKALIDGVAQAALVPMPTALGLMQQAEFARLGLVPVVMDDASLGGHASFAVAPQRPELKAQIDAALDRVKRDGRYDRINTEFLPFRID